MYLVGDERGYVKRIKDKNENRGKKNKWLLLLTFFSDKYLINLDNTT